MKKFKHTDTSNMKPTMKTIYFGLTQGKTRHYVDGVEVENNLFNKCKGCKRYIPNKLSLTCSECKRVKMLVDRYEPK